jgi:hypothetical protein
MLRPWFFCTSSPQRHRAIRVREEVVAGSVDRPFQLDRSRRRQGLLLQQRQSPVYFRELAQDLQPQGWRGPGEDEQRETPEH